MKIEYDHKVDSTNHVDLNINLCNILEIFKNVTIFPTLKILEQRNISRNVDEIDP